MIDLASHPRVEDALYESLAESRGTSPALLRGQLGSSGEIDSLEGVELIAFAEARFGVRLPDDELTSRVCRSIPQLAAAVGSRMGTETQREQEKAS